MKEISVLIARAQEGDREAREVLIEKNLGLVHHIVKRFAGRGYEMEDLFQIGTIGLIKAIDKFDTGYEVQFSTYAVPMITGEIKRFLRDDGMVKVSRPLKELSWKAYAIRERLERELGREPSLAMIAGELEVTMEELVMALDSGAEVESLQKTIYQGDGSEISLEDRLEEKSCAQDRLLDRLLLEETLDKLEARERQIIYLRYFEDKTQTEIARELGISQVQVSRMEKRIIENLRRKSS